MAPLWISRAWIYLARVRDQIFFTALVGDPRRRIQIDLLNFYKILKCGCCSNSGGTLSPSMHDTSIMYTLAQEHGDLINLHDLFQSFKASISSSEKKGLKKLASPKKRKDNTHSQNNSDACFQYPFISSNIFLAVQTVTDDQLLNQNYVKEATRWPAITGVVNVDQLSAILNHVTMTTINLSLGDFLEQVSLSISIMISFIPFPESGVYRKQPLYFFGGSGMD
ncbi:hypothetical protein FXO38_21030 [Capsicum annuum]|nr:hypothetical protein FXO38_21030 [Capsicum annuum]KAF3650684.1 hypothetical protein FXO37_18368 [Capsicum annuum]